ncbi:PA14 domain-containing protein [Cavenderia fasciculata]|uniref:PA14 domain-containing protein n=1 Tax=Cavenderia fasciculata TaxID=261658 RepID=F4PUW6_CACFS|nr:PA14 domain-containing protein [Cavenderia fasciculata]EGG21928.1 PA14 domain-containing protein [Cavenderia fasciculata]|eukprot:XP_004359779.1 PA14 domain-containing protein [Cavenderia fasciculata]
MKGYGKTILVSRNLWKSVIIMTVSVTDQFPGLNDNFEPDVGSLTHGLVKSNLNVISKIPELRSLDPKNPVNYQGRIISPNMFPYFFSPDYTNRTTRTLSTNIYFYRDTRSDRYLYQNDIFFPIDGLGFDRDPSFRKYNSEFGDDDFFLFVDNRLVSDLGGLHGLQSDHISMDDLRLSNGLKYPIDMFFCERKAPGSGFTISINFILDCSQKGDCCDPNKCNKFESNKCVKGECPRWDTKINDISTIGEYCTYTFKNYSHLDNKCQTFSCNSFDGKPILKQVVCPDKPCSTNLCNKDIGCQYTSTCFSENVCTISTCQSDNQTCSQREKDCRGPDKWYFCDPNMGCTFQPICPPSVIVNGSINPCQYYSCDSTIGECEIMEIKDCSNCTIGHPNKCQVLDKCISSNGTWTLKPNPLIDDGNACTLDSCDAESGNITHSSIKCHGCSSCDPIDRVYQCKPRNSLCTQMENKCQIGYCNGTSTNNGTCSYPAIKCPNPTKCQYSTCDTEIGCQVNDKICPDGEGPCQVAFCDETTGECKFKRRECESSQMKCLKPTCIIAGVVVTCAVVLSVLLYTAKKGYDYWKERYEKVKQTSSNPPYQTKPGTEDNPLYGDDMVGK